MTQDTLIRGYALALRDLCEQSDFATVTGVLSTGSSMTYTQGAGCRIVADGRVLEIPESALDEVGLVPAEAHS